MLFILILFRDKDEKCETEVTSLKQRIEELNSALEGLRDHVARVEQEKNEAINDKSNVVAEMENLRSVSFDFLKYDLLVTF